MGTVLENLAIARNYSKTIESGATGDSLIQFFAPEVVLEIFPSRIFHKGSRDNLTGIRAAAERGKKVISSQTYEIRNALASATRSPSKWTGRALLRAFSNHS
jgi:hypothetical protein